MAVPEHVPPLQVADAPGAVVYSPWPADLEVTDENLDRWPVVIDSRGRFLRHPQLGILLEAQQANARTKLYAVDFVRVRTEVATVYVMAADDDDVRAQIADGMADLPTSRDWDDQRRDVTSSFTQVDDSDGERVWSGGGDGDWLPPAVVDGLALGDRSSTPNTWGSSSAGWSGVSRTVTPKSN